MAKVQGLENIAAEQLILGKILQSEVTYWLFAEVLHPQHFVRTVHREIYAAIRDIMSEGKKMSLTLIDSRIGPEYEDGKSLMSLLTSYLRNADEESAGTDEVEVVIDLWRRRKTIDEAQRAIQEASKVDSIGIDVLTEHQLRISDIMTMSQSEPFESMGTITARVVNKSHRAKNSGLIPGFDTGLPSLDEIMGRIQAGDLGVIGARPGDGKTIIGAQLADRASFYGPALFEQLEMTKDQMGQRRLAGETNLSVAQIETGEYDFDELDQLRAAQERLANSNVYVDTPKRLTLEQLWTRARSAKRAKGIICLVVDHVRLLKLSGAKVNLNRFDKAEIITGGLKEIAKDLSIAVIALSQVTRASQRRDDPSPQLNDFDGGSSIEQDADWAIGAFRRDRWLKGQQPNDDPESKEFRKWAEDLSKARGKIELTSLKGRRVDPGERRIFDFLGRQARIGELRDR